MKVLSLFDGMSCGRIALHELGIVPETYYASEIDRHAIAQTRYNFPDTVFLGDVERWRDWDIDWERLDLVMGGSPCQGFSFAGKQLAFDDPRSRLFFVFAEILDYARSRNPRVKFLLENVNMKKDYLRIISERVGVFPVNINSALVSAQNRNRWYWTDIRVRYAGLFGEVYSDIPQPEDRGIFLRDILEPEADEKYYLSDRSVQKLLAHRERQKALGNGFGKSFHSPDGKMSTLKVKNDRSDDLVCISSNQAHATVAVNKSTPVVSAGGMGGGHVPMIIQRHRGYNKGGLHAEKSPALSANSWEQNNLAVIGNIYDNGHNSQAGRVYDIDGKSTALRGEAGGVGSKTGLYLSGSCIRRLTPTECARLQTVPQWYRWACSETQQYRMLGNGWTVEVIKHILSYGKWI